MRRIICILIAVLAFIGAFSAITLGSAAEFSAAEFTDVTQVHTGGTYPRMTLLQNGTLEFY